MTETSSPLADYTFHRYIHNLVFDELGRAVLRIHNKLFRGTPLADTTPYAKNQPITHSNVPRALSYNQILHQLTEGRIQVASPADVVHYWNDIPERDKTYADTDSISLFSPTGNNQDLAQKVFQLLGRTTTVPLLVAGLGIEKADNRHGFTFTETELTKAVEAPYIARDGRVCYDPKTQDLRTAQPGEAGVPVWTPGNQSGLRSAYRYRGYYLNCWYVRLLNSYADGRVQVVQKDPKGRAA
ncbi:MAG TPA: hypothetical protein VJH37_01885 [Candidatus Nanoarchaeia archaeon]|nr:hypothetical protein [Candidatus Nanoarchaeia archaeon]